MALPSDPPDAPVPPPRGASLRLRLNAIVALLMLLFMTVLLAQQIEGIRSGVREEITAGNRVAGQLLQRIGWVYRMAGPDALQEFLQQLGRVRANEIAFHDSSGRLLYRSPPPTYKQGREAPAWFAAWVAPPLQRQEIELPGGRLVVEADPSRAILDGWDDLLVSVAIGAAALLLLNALVFWAVGRTLRPFSTIVQGLARLEAGDYAARLPALPGREAATIGLAVNRMAAAVEDRLQARLAAYEAQRSLAESREIARQVELHTEQERREIARELHDELGQSVTAMRSLAISLTHRLAGRDPTGQATATLIADEAARLYDVMHGLIPRLTPLALDTLGLPDALADLAGGARQRPGAPAIELDIAPALAAGDGIVRELDGDLALAAYRVVQEALNNALRHAAASRLTIRLRLHEGAHEGTRERGPRRLEVCVEDDGCGLGEDWQRPGHYGLRGLRERVRSLGGALDIGPGGAPDAPRGVRVCASLPLPPAAAGSATDGEEAAA